MNPFDAIAILVLVLAVLAGIRTGALPQVGGIAGAVIGLLVMLNLAPVADRAHGRHGALAAARVA